MDKVTSSTARDDLDVSQSQALLHDSEMPLYHASRSKSRSSSKRVIIIVTATLILSVVIIATYSHVNAVHFRNVDLYSAAIAHGASAMSWKGQLATKVKMPFFMPWNLALHPVNETLGFGKITAISMSHRLDRRIELNLMADASRMKVDFLPGFDVKNANRKGLPWINPGLVHDTGAIGCFMAHMNAYTHIVESGLSSALILEDDIDWDVDVKKSMVAMQQATALLGASMYNSTRTPTSVDPWSTQDWDVLFLSSCYDSPFDESNHPPQVDMRNPPRIIFPDSTVSDQEHTYSVFKDYLDKVGLLHILASEKNQTQQDDGLFQRQRLLTVANGPVCLGSYAVSQRGARRLLYMASRGMSHEIDVAMSIWCRSFGLRCLIAIPPAMGQWKIKDGEAKNSDNRNGTYAQADGKQNHDPSVGNADNVRHSMRKALKEKMWQSK